MEAINYNGTLLTLTQDPYFDTVQRRIDDTVEVIDGDVYRAYAEDAEGNGYDVFWTRLSAGEVADWSNFRVLAA